ncbi:MAG TPA: cobyrinate a,c-diamide synthase [Dissulfurispiraceae bacterium]|nr:cobyrinate a,c-diamide synthase [Dissulfurispiraceae bacterium]
MKGFVIAGTHSGCGKTTVTLGLMAAIMARGLTVQSFKSGPDFIDSGVHRLATGRQAINLDLWMCGDEGAINSFCRYARLGDLPVVEGVMGMFDGDLGTSALAATLGLPVILVIDAYGMAESAGAIARGYAEWSTESGVALAGVIFNRVGSARHFERLKNSVRDIEVLGYLPRDTGIEMPSRHLGLTTADEVPMTRLQVDSLGAMTETHVRIDRVLELAALDGEEGCDRFVSRPGRIALTVRIAIARDIAFSFYYEENLDLLRDAGAEIVTFSPLWDSELPAGTDAIYLGGGYPELHAEQLASNAPMLKAISEWAAAGRPVYAECGGLMYLSKGIRDFEDRFFAMAGVLPFETKMKRRRTGLGYREISLGRDCILGRAGSALRGHEFHYSEILPGPDLKSSGIETVYHVKDAQDTSRGTEGYNSGSVLASYVHVHFASNQRAARHFVNFVKKNRWGSTKPFDSNQEEQRT